MLDDQPLSIKLTIARQWFARSGEGGEFAFTEGHRDVFARLLEDMELDALVLEARAFADAAELAQHRLGDARREPVLTPPLRGPVLVPINGGRSS